MDDKKRSVMTLEPGDVALVVREDGELEMFLPDGG
jgi:hypothetical protein